MNNNKLILNFNKDLKLKGIIFSLGKLIILFCANDDKADLCIWNEQGFNMQKGTN